MNSLIINLIKEGIKPVSQTEDEIKFEEGYESYEFYNAILSSVKNRLYIYGRKNRKIFTKNNSKICKLMDDNIDFKCLFLSDKSSDSILNMAQENNNFKKDLEKIILRIKEKYSAKIECFRKYDFQQTKRIIVVDDFIIYVPVTFENGNVKHFTKTEFSIIKADSKLGMSLLSEFKKAWDVSKSI